MQDKIVCGIKTIKSLLRNAALHLQKAGDICRTAEDSAVQLKSLNDKEVTTNEKKVDIVKNQGGKGVKPNTQTHKYVLSAVIKAKCRNCG